MTHLLQHNPNPCQPMLGRVKPRRRLPLVLAAMAGLVLGLTSCSEPSPPEKPPAVPVTDTRPVGEGLKVIGYALLGGCVVVVMGRILSN